MDIKDQLNYQKYMDYIDKIIVDAFILKKKQKKESICIKMLTNLEKRQKII